MDAIPESRRAIVLLSGGLDSATTLAVAVRELGLAAHALSFDYGQRHRHELTCAEDIAGALGAASHRLVRLDPSVVAGSALTGGADVPRGRTLDDGAIPSTYVFARNTIFLAHALAEAERRGAADLFIGANAVDYSGYPDCRPEFLVAFERLANLATRDAVEGRRRFRVQAPLLDLTKADIVRRAVALGVPLERTSSCYDPGTDGAPCGGCDSCRLRSRGFSEAGVVDPLLGGRL